MPNSTISMWSNAIYFVFRSLEWVQGSKWTRRVISACCRVTYGLVMPLEDIPLGAERVTSSEFPCERC